MKAHRPSLVSNLIFAACAATGTLLWVLGTAPFFGYGGATATCALALAVLHLLLLYPRPFARALLVEAAFGSAGLTALVLCYDGTLAGSVFGMWSFWLIQAGVSLVPEAPSSAGDDESVDAFERAHAAALAVLDRRR